MTAAAKQQESQQSIGDLIDRQAEARPDSTFLINPESGSEKTFGSSLEIIRKVAGNLQNMGAEPGDTVAYAFSNSTDAALAILGILYGGYHATAINLVAGASVISYVLDHSKAQLIVGDDDGLALIGSCGAQLEHSIQLVSLGDLVSIKTGKDTLPQGDGNTDGLLMYTSGTTGKPKGVVLTHSNLISGGMNTALAHELSENDCGLCVLPFYHINAFCVSLMATLVAGGSLVVPRKFSASLFWKILEEHACSWFSIVPTQVSYLLHQERLKVTGTNRRLRFGRSASAPLSPDMHAAFEKRFGIPLIETMGLTETAAQILSNPLPPGKRKIGSPGIAFGNEVIIGDESQKPVDDGVEGEILVRGGNVLRCYLRNEKATNEAITPDGWLRTGDLGRMDEEGYVYVTGRLKELIIKGGENIAPREVDEALYMHPDVLEAAAFATACKDYGQRVEAGVALCEGSVATEKELIEICTKKIGAFKSPDRIHFLPELPKGPSGKIQRNKLADIV